ncbi:hypothetical protein B0T16DRAFT_387781 [Cercophora newfieldiana]|uniref:Uncharacterized protein n=1 Tax=Cercophora newfieldiana TaxID=92897 RepID=A0AA39YH51_9PEZI|nr:hypothetical protein B0T16DRAFT_387781 [Cercophora newfieldiana]
MADPIIKKLAFTGRAVSGKFVPSRQRFSLERGAIFSAVRVSINGQSEGRDHGSSLIVSAVPSGDVAYSNSFQVPDRKPTTRVSLSGYFFSRIGAGDYEVEYYGSNFAENEAISVTVELLSLDTNLGDVTRDVLAAAEAEDPNTKAITFGISEASFAQFMVPATGPEIEVGPKRFLYVTAQLASDAFPWYPPVHIDIAKEEIVMSGEMTMRFWRIDDGREVADARATLTVRCQPAMLTTTKDMLQLRFASAELLAGSLTINVYDATAQGVLGGGYPSVDDFNKAVGRYVDQMVQANNNIGNENRAEGEEQKLGALIPAWIATRYMPDHWQRVQNLTARFLGFRYKTVLIHERPIAYLFLVFSIQSMGLPPDCFCEKDPALAGQNNASASPDDEVPTILSVLRNQARNQDQKLPAKLSKLLAQTGRPDYTDMQAAAIITALGISQSAFQEAAKPYSALGHDQRQSTSTDAGLYASLRFWYHVSLAKAEIVDDGIRAVVDGVAEASVKAAVRGYGKCKGRDVLSASQRLRVALRDNEIKWTPSIVWEVDKRETSVVMPATAKVSDPKVEWDGDLTPPLDEVISWVLGEIGKGYRGSLNKQAAEKCSISILRGRQDSGIRLRFVDNRFFAGQAAVVFGQLYADSWL